MRLTHISQIEIIYLKYRNTSLTGINDHPQLVQPAEFGTTIPSTAGNPKMVVWFRWFPFSFRGENLRWTMFVLGGDFHGFPKLNQWNLKKDGFSKFRISFFGGAKNLSFRLLNFRRMYPVNHGPLDQHSSHPLVAVEAVDSSSRGQIWLGFTLVGEVQGFFFSGRSPLVVVMGGKKIKPTKLGVWFLLYQKNIYIYI